MAKRGTYNRYSTGYKMLYQYGLLSKSAARKTSSSTKQYWDKQGLEGLLPSEVLIDKMRPDKYQYKKEETEARRKRIENNQKFNCELLCIKNVN